MRLHILSDLHQEFGERDVPSVDCDAVVFAGDVGTKMHGLEWIQRRFPEIPVLYICGNHEFYGEKLPSLTEKLRAATEGTNIHFLENTSVRLGDLHFFGATLWTDLALLDDWQTGATEAKAVMNDYKRIRHSGYGYRRLSPWDTRAVHLATVRALREFLTTHDPKRSGSFSPPTIPNAPLSSPTTPPRFSRCLNTVAPRQLAAPTPRTSMR